MHGANNQLSLALLLTIAISSAAEGGAFMLTTDAVVPNAVVVSYDSTDGNLSYDGNGLLITSMWLASEDHLFIVSNVDPEMFSGQYDVVSSAELFKLVGPRGVSGLDLGPVLPIGLTAESLLQDMFVDGSLQPRGHLTDAPAGGPYLYVVPEPSTGLVALLGLALTGCWSRRRRDKRPSGFFSQRIIGGTGKWIAPAGSSIRR
jgi:hypothetical protein